MEKDFLYLSKELLQKLSNIVEWIKNNPEVTDVNIYEVTECLMELGYVEKLYISIDNFEHKDICDEINDKLISLMKFMLEKRRASITDFTNQSGISENFNNFVNDMFMGKCQHDNKYKELVSKELGVLFYIYSVRKENANYQYDNTSEFEMLQATSSCYEDEFSKNLLGKIENCYKYNESRKETQPKYNKKTCYDQITFSSREEEREYIEQKTSDFDLDESLLEKTNNNGIIVITPDSFYAVDPVDIHQMAFQKLFRNIKNNDVFLDISEVEDYYVYEGNILIRTVNRGGVVGFDPYIPQKINEYQINKLEGLLIRLNKIYDELEMLDDKNANNIKYGIDTIKNSK